MSYTKLKPRMQRATEGYLKDMLDQHLTDAEWKTLSDKVCQRAYDKQVEVAGRTLNKILDSGPHF